MTKRNSFLIALVLVTIIGVISYMSEEAAKSEPELPQIGQNANATAGS